MAEHVKPGILHIIQDLEKELTTLEENVKPTWKDLVEPLERISDRISRAWGTVSHLKVSFFMSFFDSLLAPCSSAGRSST